MIQDFNFINSLCVFGTRYFHIYSFVVAYFLDF